MRWNELNVTKEWVRRNCQTPDALVKFLRDVLGCGEESWWGCWCCTSGIPDEMRPPVGPKSKVLDWMKAHGVKSRQMFVLWSIVVDENGYAVSPPSGNETEYWFCKDGKEYSYFLGEVDKIYLAPPST